MLQASYDIDICVEVWAYSRMSVGCRPKPNENWKHDIQFPLMKTWEVRLRESKAVMKLKDVRKEINNMLIDSVST